MDAQKIENDYNLPSSADFGIKVKQLDQKQLLTSLPYYCIPLKQLEFSYICGNLLRKMAINDPPYVYKMLRGICKLMELNEFEIVFWNQINIFFDYGKQLQPKYQSQIKIVAFNNFKDFLQILDVDNVAQYKRQLLFCTLSAFYTLKYLRQIERLERLTEFIKEEIFIKLLTFLYPVFEDASKLITLPKLNQQYQQLTQQDEPDKEEDQVNYNKIVDQIIEMAPAYQKDEEVAVSHKVKRQKKLISKKQEKVEQVQKEEVQDIQPPMFQRQNSGGMFLRSSQPVFKINSIDSAFNQPSINQFLIQDMFLNTSSKFNILSKNNLK